MPSKDMSSKIGSSPSPVAERVIKNNINVQQTTCDPKVALSQKFTKQPVKVG